MPQSRPSTRLFLQSSELGPPTPSLAGECVLNPLWLRGMDTFACGRGDGGPNSDEGTDNCGTLGIYTLYSMYFVMYAIVLFHFCLYEFLLRYHY
jgi:hypothetical protein